MATDMGNHGDDTTTGHWSHEGAQRSKGGDSDQQRSRLEKVQDLSGCMLLICGKEREREREREREKEREKEVERGREDILL